MREPRQPAVDIFASGSNGTLHVGVMSDLMKYVGQHQERVIDGFIKDHGGWCLVYFERHDTMVAALAHEKQCKIWRHEWQTRLIEQFNPQ